MTNKALDDFGKLVATQVRDGTVVDWNNIVEGRIRAPVIREISQPLLENLSNEQKKLLRELGLVLIDTTLHNFLFMFEGQKWIRISLETGEGVIPDIREVATGDLQGYVFDWAERFGQQSLSALNFSNDNE